MLIHRTVAGPAGSETVDLTAEEIAVRDTEAVTWAASQPDRDKENNNTLVLEQIATLEASTLRALRDSARGNGDIADGQGKTPKGRLDDIEAQIIALRGTLLP